MIGDKDAPSADEWADRACPTCTVRKGWQSELNPLAVRYPLGYVDESIWRVWRIIAEPTP